MQPLNTTPRPSSLSIMGCWEEGAGSRILSRRCPNAIEPCAKKPAASGPRDCIDSVALESSTSETLPLVLTSPQNPHMPVFRTPLPFYLTRATTLCDRRRSCFLSGELDSSRGTISADVEASATSAWFGGTSVQSGSLSNGS